MTDIAEPKQDKRGHVTMGAGPHDLIHPAERPLRRLFLAFSLVLPASVAPTPTDTAPLPNTPLTTNVPLLTTVGPV